MKKTFEVVVAAVSLVAVYLGMVWLYHAMDLTSSQQSKPTCTAGPVATLFFAPCKENKSPLISSFQRPTA